MLEMQSNSQKNLCIDWRRWAKFFFTKKKKMFYILFSPLGSVQSPATELYQTLVNKSLKELLQPKVYFETTVPIMMLVWKFCCWCIYLSRSSHIGETAGLFFFFFNSRVNLPFILRGIKQDPEKNKNKSEK